MGIFDFVKDAGPKVGLGSAGDSTNATASGASNAHKSVNLEKHVADLGLSIDKLDISFADGKATVSGSAETQEIREKAILAVGNVDGVDKVEDKITVVHETAASSMHTVVSGDTLSKLAESVYGDASKFNVIFEANKPLLKDPDKIYVGQVLRIPAEA